MSGAYDLVVVALGNPGDEYAGTRHNVGWEVVDVLARRGGLSFSRARERALIAHGEIDRLRIALIKPTTFMNDSGAAVKPLLRRFDAEPAQVVAVYDDMDLAFGRLRIRQGGGGTGGHQGVNSLVAHLHSKDFHRLKVGIGRPPGRMDPAVYILRRFTKAERPEVDVLVEEAADAVEAIAEVGVDAAANRYNADRSEA